MHTDHRPDWDEYFLIIAEAVATRSDCERSKVGAVVVKDRRVRATGYNGAPAGRPGCDTCPRRLAEAVPGVSSYDSGPTRCVSVHAEANALLYCDREDLIGATLYITRPPCPGCQKLIDAVGITRVVTPETKPYTVDALWRERERQWFESGPPWTIAVERDGEVHTFEVDHLDIGNTRYC
ncbi:dCMP deaminase [Mycobacterium phage Rebeuca]|uniref:Deoxycytidylate deaminase n=2 Tax=Fromanvirus rebeuca TaxID=1225862 RepID=A0A482JK70_9CAUD|nr:dCMP deaminase [Mycobacterium phage Rebeuca]AFQ97345.1 cytidine deaminase [Mycobacterium phage Rebeuca]QBP31986.1 deoxycytidylate deaminase [Mycobacterium phage Kristoff]